MRPASIRLRNKVIILGVVVLTLASVVTLALSARGDSRTDVAKKFQDVPIDQTVQRGEVSVTLEKLRIGNYETQLTYRYDAPSSQVEPFGIPTIALPGGDQLEASGGGGFDGNLPVTRTFMFPLLQDAESISVDVGSFIEYASVTASVEIPLGGEGGEPDDIGAREVPLSVVSSVGDAEYRVTKLLLERDSFVLVCEPTNGAASRMILGGPGGNFRLTDDQDGSYDGFAAGAEWSPALSSGHTMSYQGLYFDGLPNSSSTSFTLYLDGVGHIRAPFVFQVDIPQGEES